MTSGEVQIRVAREEEREKVIDLAKAVFRLPDLDLMLPSFFAPHNVHQLAIAAVGGDIVSLVGAVRFGVRAGPFSYEAAHIGSVCTDPTWRQRGLAGRVLAFQYELLRGQGVDVAFISGHRDLYLRSGATPAGGMGQYTVSSQLDPGLLLMPLEPDHVQQAARLWALEPVTIVRSPHTWRRVLPALPVRPGWTRVSVLVGDSPEAYVILDSESGGGGSEVREMGGVRALAVRAARHLAARAGSPKLAIPVPDWDRALTHELAPLDPVVRSQPFPGTYRLLDPMRTFRQLILVAAQLDPALERYRMWPTGDGFVIEGGASPCHGDVAWVCRVLFGAEGRMLSDALPVPLPWWYGLSYG